MKNKDTSPGDREQQSANPSAEKVVAAVGQALNIEPATLQEAQAQLKEAREKLAVEQAARRSLESELRPGGITADRAAKLKAMKEGGLSPDEMNRDRAERIRDEIKSKAFLRNGLKMYTNPNDAAYRAGVYYPPNSLIELPVEEDPSVTWVAVTRADFKAPGVTVTTDDRIAMSQMQERNIKRAADVDVTA